MKWKLKFRTKEEIKSGIDFGENAYFLNYFRVRLFNFIFFICNLLIVLINLYTASNGIGNKNPFSKYYMPTYIALTIYFLIMRIVSGIKAPKKVKRLKWWHKLQVHSFIFAVIIWFTSITFIDLRVNGGITVYALGLLGLAVILFLNLVWSILIYSTTAVFFFLLLRSVQFSEDKFIADLLNGSIMIVVSFIISQVIYIEKKNQITKDSLIEKQKQELEKQIDMAGNIQESLLPRNIPDLEQLKIAIKYQPMMKLGGDFFDMRYDKGNNCFGFFLCDVSGHGVPAALLAAMVKMSLTFWYENLNSLTKSFQFIYNSIFDKLGKNFITASLLHINLSSGIIKTARAGHFPVMIITKTREIIRLNSIGKIIMAIKTPECEEVEYKLTAGDRIVIYTDGIIEARSPHSKDLYSEERMNQFLSDSNHLDIHLVADQFFQSIIDFSGGLEFIEDDLTFVLMEYNP